MATDHVDPDAFKRWTPTAQEKALEAVRQIAQNNWKPFYCPVENCNGAHHIAADPQLCTLWGHAVPHKWVKVGKRWQCARGECQVYGTPIDEWLFPHARANQHPPKGDWLVWLIRGGRGSGKTRPGAEWVHRRTKISPRIALIGRTGPDARAYMIEGESGLLATAAPDNRPIWEPSKKELTWPNGAKAFVFSAEEPDRLRGPQHHDAWLDEPAHFDNIEEVWSNLLFGLRLIGQDEPRICCTTTPVPTKWVKDTIADPDTVSVIASTYENVHNLAPKFAKVILTKYEGTRKGRQEIHGEVLADVEGALWQYEYLENRILDKGPREMALEMDRIVVAVDPAGTHRKRSDETGIVVVGAKGEDFYVLADYSGKYSPAGWAGRAVAALHEFGADSIVAEVNYGGDMVRSTLENADEDVRIVEVTSRRGKVIRADPIVALYEKGRVWHVGVNLGDLEDQLVGWVPGNESPDRLDALVHGLTDVARTVEPSSVASPTELRALAGVPGLGSADSIRQRLQLVRTA